MDSIVNSTPKISVLMPVYNCELYIKKAIDSILNQTYSDFEFLIIDDASTDETVSIIKSYNDARIQLIEKPINSGYTNSLNYGLKLAKGKYIARMDGDDISLPERFAKQVDFLDKNLDVVLCGTAFCIIGTNEIISIPQNHEEIKLALLKNNCIAHPSVMMRKSILDKGSILYDLAKEPSEDYDLWVRLISKGKLHNLLEVLLKYRIHDKQVSQKRTEQQLNNAIEIKLYLLYCLDLEMQQNEREVLKKIITRNSNIKFDEFVKFQEIKSKLLQSNNGYFEKNGFYQYLMDLDFRNVKKYFLNKNKFTPLTYWQYLKIKSRLYYRISFLDEFKLLVKSLIFYKK